MTPESVVAPDEVEQVSGRSMLVKRLKPLPVEAVVRGYLAGSRLEGVPAAAARSAASRCRRAAERQPAARSRSSRRPPRREPGEHDENITFAQTRELIGAELAEQRARHRDPPLPRGSRLRADTRHHHRRHQVRVRPRRRRHADADGRGADARFVALLAARVAIAKGVNPPSYDKQFLRDWLEQVQVNGKEWNKKAPAPPMPFAVVEATRSRYFDASRRLADGESLMR